MKAIVLALAAVAALAQTPADQFRMNQTQVLGSHNSYKQAIDPSLLKLLHKDNPRRYESLEYEHASFSEQLGLGLRKLEIDVVYDPKGGLYAHPLGLRMVQEAGAPAGPKYDPDGLMMKPGFKVLHMPDIDFRSHVYTFKHALAELKTWSDAHPRHLPILITMNAKDSGSSDAPEFVQPLLFDRKAYDAWDAEIREVLPAEKLLTPDDVRGDFNTLEEAVLSNRWPTLGEARGRFLFILDENGAKMETYIQGHPSLGGRVMFVNATEGRPEAALRIVNDAIGDFHYIQKLVRAGYVVRTRADANTREARAGDYSTMKAAFASGAQYVSTDYYYPNKDFGTGYQVQLPGGGAGRWNPLLTPPLEELPPLE
jgi:hypothetical protein